MRWASEDTLPCAVTNLGIILRPCLAPLQPNRTALHVVVRALCFLAQWKMQMRTRR